MICLQTDLAYALKPMTPEDAREQLKKLRYPVLTGGPDT